MLGRGFEAIDWKHLIGKEKQLQKLFERDYCRQSFSNNVMVCATMVCLVTSCTNYCISMMANNKTEKIKSTLSCLFHYFPHKKYGICEAIGFGIAGIFFLTSIDRLSEFSTNYCYSPLPCLGITAKKREKSSRV